VNDFASHLLSFFFVFGARSSLCRPAAAAAAAAVVRHVPLPAPTQTAKLFVAN